MTKDIDSVKVKLSERNKAIYGETRSDDAGRDALINTGADGNVFELIENSKYTRSAKDTKDHKKTDYFPFLRFPFIFS